MGFEWEEMAKMNVRSSKVELCPADQTTEVCPLAPPTERERERDLIAT